MKFFIYFILIISFFTNPSQAKWGKGELKLSKETMETVIMYMYGAGNKKYSGAAKRKNDPMMMAISEDGESYYYFYCPVQYNNNCVETGIAHDTIIHCQKYSNGSPCFIFAKKRRIVWKNGGPKVKIKKKDLKSPYVVAKKLQEAGFYDGDISKLVGIDVSTGQINEEISITGEKETNVSETKTDEKDLVKELETLTKLFEGGALTKEEFEEAKKKLLAN